MTIETKTDGSAVPASGANLEERFAAALDLLYRNRRDEAVTALEAMEIEAGKSGQVAMARAARTYLTALRSHGEPKEVPVVQPEMAAQLCLNRGETDGALALLDKALATQDKDARLFYLKAIAHAQKDEAEAAAAAIRRAASLNPDILHQVHLEPDFDRIRSTSFFAALGMD